MTAFLLSSVGKGGKRMMKLAGKTTEFEGKVAIITGAASGIGKAIAFDLLEKGAKLVLADIDMNRLTKTFSPENEVNIKLVKANVCESEERQFILKRALEYGSVDYLINAAGVIQVKNIFEVDESDWDSIQNVNAKACFFMCQLVGDYWRKQNKPGNIINFSSSAAKMATTPALAAYSASKVSVVAMTKAFAHTLAHTGTRVNCVCPGVIQTPMQDELQSQLETKLESKVTWESRIDRIPMKREGSSEEVASVVRFLLSQDSSYMTGQSINITGGMLME